jgi:hypothetical protein
MTDLKKNKKFRRRSILRKENKVIKMDSKRGK